MHRVRAMKACLFVLCGVAVILAVPCAIAREYSVFDVVGDSVSQGVNPDGYSTFQLYGWVHMMFGQSSTFAAPPEDTLTDLWPAITRYNSAWSGSTAAEWANTNANSLLRTVLGHHPDLVVVMIGGNDFLDYMEDGTISTAEWNAYSNNFSTIVSLLRNNTPVPEIVVVGYYDLFDGYSASLPSQYAQYRPFSQAAIAGNAMMRSMAESRGCFYVSVHEGFMHHCYGQSLGDTGHLTPDYVHLPLAPGSFDIHPVTAGHRHIHSQVFTQLAELKEIPKITDLRLVSGQMVIEWTSGFGQQYTIGRCQNPTMQGGFQQVFTGTGFPPSNVYTASISGTGSSFYRLGE